MFHLVISVELPLLEDPLQGALGKLTIWNKLTERVKKWRKHEKYQLICEADSRSFPFLPPIVLF